MRLVGFVRSLVAVAVTVAIVVVGSVELVALVALVGLVGSVRSFACSVARSFGLFVCLGLAMSNEKSFPSI